MKVILNKRIGRRRFVFALVSRSERRRLRPVATAGAAAVASLYGLRRLGRRSGAPSGEDEGVPFVDTGEPRLADPPWEVVPR